MRLSHKLDPEFRNCSILSYQLLSYFQILDLKLKLLENLASVLFGIWLYYMTSWPGSVSWVSFFISDIIHYYITCADTFAPSYLNSSSRNVGSAAKQAERKKFHFYTDLTHQFFFNPVATETSGRFWKVSIRFRE